MHMQAFRFEFIYQYIQIPLCFYTYVNKLSGILYFLQGFYPVTG